MGESANQRIIAALQATRTIAVVGASPDPERHSHRVMAFMQRNGYRVVPVNPTVTVGEILGEQVYPRLDDVPGTFEMVDVFRRREAIPQVVEDVVRVRSEKGVRYLWLQLGLVDEAAAGKARAAGVEVFMDRCLKIEFGRLLSCA